MSVIKPEESKENQKEKQPRPKPDRAFPFLPSDSRFGIHALPWDIVLKQHFFDVL
jgi:hypothetical protein